MLFLAFAGPTELWVILGIVVILFGAKKLPGRARAMGSSISQFKEGLSEENKKAEQLSQTTNETSKDGE